MRSRWWAGLALVAGVGCADEPRNGAAGDPCVRLSQCAPGLACVAGACSEDLGPLAEAGVVPVLDAGTADGAAADATATDAASQPDAPINDQDAGN